MNASSAHMGRSAGTSGWRLVERSSVLGQVTPSPTRDIERLRAGIWVVLESLEAGDVWAAADLLLALVEEREAA